MLSLSGVCFLHDYELQQCTDREKLLGVRWTERDVIRTPIYVKEGRQTVASLVVRHPKAKWSVLSTKDGPAFQLTIQAQGSLIELRRPLSRERLAKLAAQTVKQEIQQAYEWGVNRNIDVLNVSDQLYRSNVHKWRQWEQNGIIPLKRNHSKHFRPSFHRLFRQGKTWIIVQATRWLLHAFARFYGWKGSRYGFRTLGSR